MSREELVYLKTLIEVGQYPLLYKRMGVVKEELVYELTDIKLSILNFVEVEYPDNHPFKQSDFIYGSYLLAFAYSKYVCEKRLYCKEIMWDFIEKKLKSSTKEKFNSTIFNENLSEYTIFFYLFTSIYFKSDLYQTVIRLEYETSAADNKKFEYTFVLKDERRINVEVKTLLCDPFVKDNLNHWELVHGQKFIKYYFDTHIGNKIINLNGTEYGVLKSNYRQLNKNIKKIIDKFALKTKNDINLGFVIINYGTSQEEYFAYLLNTKQGILGRLDVSKVDNLILFSMWHSTTFEFDEVYSQNHILSFNQNIGGNEELFEKLRLDNYILKDGKIKPHLNHYIEKTYNTYKFVKLYGACTILEEELEEEIIDMELKKFESISKASLEIQKIVEQL